MRGLFFTAALFFAAAFANATVRINEFLADNGGSFTLPNGGEPDWIELHNDGNAPVDLAGWRLTDSANNPAKWVFPSAPESVIPANGYLLVIADSSATPVQNGRLHANFSLSKDGEYLALVRPDGTVANAFAPEFPPQLKDVSYGLAQKTTEWVGEGTPARYFVPDVSGPGSEHHGAGALGFADLGGTFTVTYYKLNAPVNSVDDAEAMIANPAHYQNPPHTVHPQTVNYTQEAAVHAFAPHNPFPTHASVNDSKNWFVLKCETALHIPDAGEWTFNVASDDGFRLRITGHGVDFVSEFPWLRGMGHSLATFNFPKAGVYGVSLLFFQNEGGAAVTFSAAKGFQTVFNSSFKLVGDPSGGVQHAGPVGAQIETDVANVMKNVNSRLDAEWDFYLDALPDPGDTVRLAVRYADGFVASVNNTPLQGASKNAPSPLAWDSVADAARAVNDVMVWEFFDVPPSCLAPGANTLRITALNSGAGNGTFFIQPRLVLNSGVLRAFYFADPTPGAPNGKACNPPTPEIVASEPRGYKTSAFNVALSGAPVIRYTLDGSVPTPHNGLTYSAPIPVSKTTVLRAAAPDAESIRQTTSTYTWIFAEDVIRQPHTTPPGWPADRQVNNRKMVYGMHQGTVNADTAGALNGLTNSIATISLVTDLAHLFSPQTGIYANPHNQGAAWERPVSVEIIDPVRGPQKEAHIDGGLRIRGAYSRSTENPKHSLRLFFRAALGDSKLHFPLFDEEGADAFDRVDLRAENNYSWAFENSTHHTMVRDVFSRDTQRDMGVPYTRTRYYHLYINGQYWGVYSTQERGDNHFAAAYLGGRKDDWDCVKTSQPGYTTTATDGTIKAFHDFHTLAVAQGFENSFAGNYQRALGRNPDGSPNPSFPVYLDEENLAAYMLCAWYVGDPDAPVSDWGNMVNNLYALFNRENPAGFIWLRHDAEHSLGGNRGYGPNCDTTMIGANFTEQHRFNPAVLHHKLAKHPAYLRNFADTARRHLHDNGALTPDNARARLQARMDEVDPAVILESARWGNGQRTRQEWLNECGWILNTYLPGRRDLLAAQLKARGWYPSIEPPDISHYGKTLPPGATVTLFGDTPFYYTLDGSDPLMPDGSPNPAALVSSPANPPQPVALVARGAVWKYYDLGHEPGAQASRLWSSPLYDDTAWPSGPAMLGFPGNDNANAVATQTRRFVSGNSGPQVTTTYFRHAFNVAALPSGAVFNMTLLRDDGLVMYLNGVEIFRDNMPAGPVTYGTHAPRVVGAPEQNTYYPHTLDIAHLLQPGVNTLAIELHQCNDTSTDLYLDLDLIAAPPGATAAHTATVGMASDLKLRARAFANSEWSALSQSNLRIEAPDPDYNDLRICEIMHAPYDTPGVSPGDRDNFAYLSIVNTGPVDINLNGVTLDVNIWHTFTEDLILPPNGAMFLVKSVSSFNARYANPNAFPVRAWTGASGKNNIARNGGFNNGLPVPDKEFHLMDPRGNTLQFIYYDSRFFNGATKNTGKHLVARDLSLPGLDPLWDTEDAWRASVDGQPVGHALPHDNDAACLGLRFYHFMPAPRDPDRDDYAFFSIVNTGPAPVNLRGVAFHNNINHLFLEDLVLPSSGWLVMAASTNAFPNRYSLPPGVPLRQIQRSRLNRNGDFSDDYSMCISAPAGTTVQRFIYDTNVWLGGAGKNAIYHYVAANPLLPVDAPGWSDGGNWVLSAGAQPVAPPVFVFESIRPVITGMRLEGKFLILSYESEEPVSVEYKNNLALPGWFAWPAADDGEELAIDLEALETADPSGSRFFRLVLE